MRRRDFIRLLGGAALEPFSVSPVFAGSPSGCGAPVARDDGWPVAFINGDMVIDRGTLCKITDRLAASSTANVHAVLVARGGKLVFERYFRGSDEIYGRPVGNVTFDANTLNDMKSVSKSVASHAVGIAIDRGLIGSTNEPIFSFFPELSDLRSPEKERIQLLHARRFQACVPGRNRADLWHVQYVPRRHRRLARLHLMTLSGMSRHSACTWTGAPCCSAVPGAITR